MREKESHTQPPQYIFREEGREKGFRMIEQTIDIWLKTKIICSSVLNSF